MVRRFDLCPSSTSIANIAPQSHWPADQNAEKDTTLLALLKLSFSQE